MVSGLEDSKKGTVEIFVVSDRLEACQGIVHWKVTDLTGKILEQSSVEVEIPSRESHRVKTLDLAAQCKSVGADSLLIWLKLVSKGKVISENLVSFARPKDLKLLEPGLKTQIALVKDGFRVSLTAERPALYTWLSMDEADASYSDNFVHLDGQNAVEILVHPKQPMTREEFAKALCVRSVFDTYVPIT